MSQILIYSRSGKNQVNGSLEILSTQLNEIGHNTEHTHSTNWARIFLNHYDVIHLFVEKLPLNVNELFFISLARTLMKPIVLSLFNCDGHLTKPLTDLVCPDVLTVSQTNHFQYYRDWQCSKALLPLFPQVSNAPSRLSNTKAERSFLIPFEESLDEVFKYKIKSEVYYDGRLLLKNNSSSSLRKKWSQYLQSGKIPALSHLILSEEKLNDLLHEENLQVILASPGLKHTEFTAWLEKTLNHGHLLYINEFQATGFSQAWTSGRNCEVLGTHHWPKSLNQFVASESNTSGLVSRLKNSEITEPLLNELSRLYSKILRQKTTLISSSSAKIKS